MMAKALPERKDVDEKLTCDLTAIFETEEDYEKAEYLYQEIEALLEYWRYRTWKPIDRVLDDQMLIRLVKIRHKLNFDDF